MDPKKLPKETYCVPEILVLLAQLNSPLAASVDGGHIEDVNLEDWTI